MYVTRSAGDVTVVMGVNVFGLNKPRSVLIYFLLSLVMCVVKDARVPTGL